jgi:hypothetical protein
MIGVMAVRCMSLMIGLLVMSRMIHSFGLKGFLIARHLARRWMLLQMRVTMVSVAGRLMGLLMGCVSFVLVMRCLINILFDHFSLLV